MLLVTEIYGLWALAMLTWFSWSRPRRGAAAGDARAERRRLRLHLRRAGRGGAARRWPAARALDLPAHDLPARRRAAAARWRSCAELAGAEYLTRPDNSHAKAGNINAALPRTERRAGADARRRPRADAGRARRAGRLLRRRADGAGADARTTSSTTTRSSTTRSAATSSRSSTRVICPGKDRHGAAFWCGSAALIRRARAARDRRRRRPRRSPRTSTRRSGCSATAGARRYHDEVLVQGLAPHDLDGYLLQRDRWARGNLAVFTTAGVAAARARAERRSSASTYFASLAAYLAPARCGCCCC